LNLKPTLVFAVIGEILVVFIDPHFTGMIMKAHDSNTPIPNLQIRAVANALLSEPASLGEVGNHIMINYHAGLGRDLYRVQHARLRNGAEGAM